jgi:hypothetical protein
VTWINIVNDKNAMGLAQVFLVGLISLILFSSAAVAADVSVSTIGTVNGTKDAFVKTAFGSWAPLEGKTYPAVDGTALKAENGVTALTTKDLAGIQGGTQSEFIVRGTTGSYAVELQKGPLGFRVPADVTLTVSTPTAIITVESKRGHVTKASRDPKSDRYGVIIFDGKGTKVASLNGTVGVVNLNGSSRQVLAKGATVYVSGGDEGFRISLAQLAQDEESKLVSPFVLAAEIPFVIPWWWYPAGTGAGILLASGGGGGGGGGGPVSPVKP